MEVDCKCKPPLCEHTEHKVNQLLQETYDDGYDDGWDAAFAMLNSVLRDKGINPPQHTPAPPPRGKRKGELIN